MEIKRYQFGTVVFQVISSHPMMKDSRFEAFTVDETANVDFTYEILPPIPGREPTLDLPIVLEREHDYFKAYMDPKLLPKIAVAHFFSGAQTAKLLPEREHVMLHCSYVLRNEKALLFCAPSGTGKSTQAQFWKSLRGTETINEDRALIGKVDGTYYAHGCWAMGHGSVCRNVSAPICAIILLGQGKQNRVYHLHPAEILSRMIPECSFDDKNSCQCKKMIELAADLISAVPVLGYDCVNDMSSVDELEKYL